MFLSVIVHNNYSTWPACGVNPLLFWHWSSLPSMIVAKLSLLFFSVTIITTPLDLPEPCGMNSLVFAVSQPSLYLSFVLFSLDRFLNGR